MTATPCLQGPYLGQWCHLHFGGQFFFAGGVRVSTVNSSQLDLLTHKEEGGGEGDRVDVCVDILGYADDTALCEVMYTTLRKHTMPTSRPS